MVIKAQMSSSLARYFEDARQISWSPKLPFSQNTGTFQTHSSHLEEVCMYIQTKVIPIAYYDIEFAVSRARDLLTETCRRQIDLLSRSVAINASGIVNFYQDFIYLRNFIREQQQTMQ